MSALSLTPAQTRVAHRGGGDACVLAGAGSGKTTVLTERFRTLVVGERIPARRVAALTFTDKAASEMRERIARAFAEDADPRVRSLAREVEFAPIATIHAFCARLLREHALAAGVDPAFVLLDEQEAAALREDAWLRTDRRLRRTNDPDLRVLARLGEEDAWRTIADLHERLRGLGLSPDDLRSLPGVPVADTLADLARARDDLWAAAVAARLDPDARRDFERTFGDLPTPEALAGAGADAARLAAAVEPRGRSVNEAVALPDRCATKERRALFAAYAAVAGAVADEVALREVDAPVRRLVAALGAAYADGKRAEGALDFTDLERHALALLERLDALGRPLEGAPRRILLDEFQDTNPLQARLLVPLRRPPGAPPVDFFAVGDPKQSIYRFRRADVGVMLGEWESAGPSGQERLTESFRSRPETVRFHNALFERLFRAGAAGASHEPLEARGRFHLPDEEILPEVLAVDGSDPAFDAPREDAEAAAVARRLRGWITGGATRTKAERAPDGTWSTAPRPLRWRDMAVLVRTHARGKAFERAFTAAGIPFQVGRGRGFYDTPEIADLVHALRVVHDPQDRFALAAFLVSPAVGATDEDLLACGAAGTDPFEVAAGLARTGPAVAAVRALRRVAVEGSLEETVRAVLDAFDLLPVALLQPGGARRARNLEKALAIARRLDDEGGHGLLDFLRRLQDLRDRHVDEAEASAGGPEDAVSILTVHAAKGLEWPCVVVAGTNGRGGDDRAPYLLDGAGGVGWRLLDLLDRSTIATGGYARLRAADREAASREDLRLLYVALTRAEERLVVSFSFGERRKDGEPGRVLGWAKEVWSAIEATGEIGERVVALGDARVRVRVEAASLEDARDDALRPWFRRHGDRALLAGDVPVAEPAAAADAWARVAAPPATLGATPFVVTISDLLAFAHGPSDFHASRIVGEDGAAAVRARAAERDDPASGAEGGPDDDVRRAARRERWDEGREVLDGIDRAALGRAVHLAIERLTADPAAVERTVEEALVEEHPDGVPPAARDAAHAMVRRFLGSATGAAFLDALAAGREVRREAAFHARIRFPDGAEVAGFDSLLVKGSVDLWLPDGEGRVRLYDHKTNSPRGPSRGADALVARYGPQLRLYALAAERVLSREVSGAALLLLDPAWAAQGVPVEVPVDVSGPALEETRRLARAFAVAMHESRFPADWRSL